MEPKSFKRQDNKESLIIKVNDDTVEFYHMDNSDLAFEDCDTESLLFNRQDYAEGLNCLIKTGSCLIKGKVGSLEIIEKSSKRYRLNISVESHKASIETGYDIDLY